MEPVRCFLLVETERVRLSLRRYTDPGCYGKGSWGYHNALVVLGDAPVLWEPTEYGGKALALRPERTIPQDDTRWPAKCDFCEHRFVGYPYYPQVSQELYYRRPETGEERLLRDWDPGAMWFVDWMGPGWVGPDGKTLVVKLPDGVDWAVDGPAGNSPDTSKPGWTRTGTPPKVTARPSILTSRYHGYLTDGVLRPC